MRLATLTSIMILLFMHCDKEDNIPNIYSGSITATLNNAEWVGARPTASYDENRDNYVVSFHVYSGDFLRESLDIFGLKRNQLLYGSDDFTTSIDRNNFGASFNYVGEDGDVVCQIFTIDTNFHQGFVEITNFNVENGNISGNFDIQFLRIFSSSVGNCNGNASDTIRIRNGEFSTRITNM